LGFFAQNPGKKLRTHAQQSPYTTNPLSNTFSSTNIGYFAPNKPRGLQGAQEQTLKGHSPQDAKKDSSFRTEQGTAISPSDAGSWILETTVLLSALPRPSSHLQTPDDLKAKTTGWVEQRLVKKIKMLTFKKKKKSRCLFT
jgi:hypothetical protein